MAETDPRDKLAYGVSAFSGLVDLMYDAQSVRGASFEASTPSGLYALLSLVRDEIEPATKELQGYVPRK